VIGRGPVY